MNATSMDVAQIKYTKAFETGIGNFAVWLCVREYVCLHECASMLVTTINQNIYTQVATKTNKMKKKDERTST
jgi:hypothetical protein